MKVLLSVVLTLLAIVPALCWPVNDDVKEPYAFANVNPGVQDQMFQDYPPETQRYVDDTNYYAAFQGNDMHHNNMHACIIDSLNLDVIFR